MLNINYKRIWFYKDFYWNACSESLMELISYPDILKEITMSKILIAAVAIAIAVVSTGCTSLRTPTKGPNANNVYYNTFMGISIESAVYGDGIIVGK